MDKDNKHFDGNCNSDLRFNDNHCHDLPYLNTWHDNKLPNVIDTDKKSEIYDKMHNLKFIVSMTKENIAFPVEKPDYIIRVISFCFAIGAPKMILEKVYRHPVEADKAFHELVQRYSYIADVETKDFENIGLYAHKIKYRCVQKCCATCKWSKCTKCDHNKLENQMPSDSKCKDVPPPSGDIKIDDKHIPYRPIPTDELVCTNHKLFTPRGVLNDINDHPEHHHNTYNDYFRQRLDDVEPKIRPEFICDFYEPKLKENNPNFMNHEYDQYGNWIKNDDIYPCHHDKGKMW